MENLWQRMWDRYGARYSWVVYVISFVILLPIFITATTMVVAFQDSDRYAVAVVAAVVAALAALYLTASPGSREWRRVERWAAERGDDPQEALEATYVVGRRAVHRGPVGYAVIGGVTGLTVAAIAGAHTGGIAQWAVLDALLFAAVALIAVHSYAEAFLRPPRMAIIADTGAGDAMPRSRPTFATWSNLTLVTAAFAFSLAGALFGGVIRSAHEHPGVAVLIAAGLTVFFAVPITVGSAFSPSLRPLRELAAGTARVAAGEYQHRLPVVQDDDLGVLVASFNRMQSGLAERERLRAAFGSYVDPSLAARLLEQGDELFSGERRVVTVMFVDIRDFTPFAEAHTAEETVAHLNVVFDLIVPVVIEAGGHVNKYLGDGALAVFGVPNDLAAHADAAVSAAVTIRERVAERFAGATRIGIGVNTGQVIAGTIGGAGKLEFTLIGDTVNVAARVEQLTKETGDAILLTEHTVAALTTPQQRLIDRGSPALKGKATATRVFALGA